MTTTPQELYGVSKNDWIEYEQLRRSGIMNMFDSRETLGLSKAEFSAILRHFGEMKDAWVADVPKENPFAGLRETYLEGDDEEED